jgi:hypothetical protein
VTFWDVVPEWEGKPDEEAGTVVNMADREPASNAIIVAKREGWENSMEDAHGGVAYVRRTGTLEWERFTYSSSVEVKWHVRKQEAGQS